MRIDSARTTRLPQLLCALGLLTGISGCLDVRYTRMPTWHTSFPAAENTAYQRTDPFPDPDIGPSLEASPRGYDRPRSESRRAAEQRILHGLPAGPEAVPPGVPQGGQRRPRAVY